MFAFLRPYCHFWICFELKKTRIEISRRLVKISVCGLRSETISYICGWCRYQNNPRLSCSLRYRLISFWLLIDRGIFENMIQTEIRMALQIYTHVENQPSLKLNSGASRSSRPFRMSVLHLFVMIECNSTLVAFCISCCCSACSGPVRLKQQLTHQQSKTNVHQLI